MGIEKLFLKILIKNFPNLNSNPLIQEARQIQEIEHTKNQNKAHHNQIVEKTDRKKNLKGDREYRHIVLKEQR